MLSFAQKLVLGILIAGSCTILVPKPAMAGSDDNLPNPWEFGAVIGGLVLDKTWEFSYDRYEEYNKLKQQEQEQQRIYDAWRREYDEYLNNQQFTPSYTTPECQYTGVCY